jgi:ABC-type phosphate transport system auxiliary subunit
LLLESSEKYRDEVRSDMERLKLELEKQAKQCNDELSSMKLIYENELHSMQTKMTALTEEVAEYRRENGALHLLLRDRGVEIPSWVKK